MKPLLVCLTYPPEQATQRDVDNLSNLIELDFDTQVISLEPQTWTKPLREGFLRFSNFQKAPEYEILASVPFTAIKHNIPLILWGENPGHQISDLNALGKTGYDGNQLRFMNNVSGGNLSWLEEDGIKSISLIQYKYPTPD